MKKPRKFASMLIFATMSVLLTRTSTSLVPKSPKAQIQDGISTIGAKVIPIALASLQAAKASYAYTMDASPPPKLILDKPFDDSSYTELGDMKICKLVNG
jgi:hypothetical protein